MSTPEELGDQGEFSVIDTEAEYGILVHAVADGRRQPDYWLNRLQ